MIPNIKTLAQLLFIGSTLVSPVIGQSVPETKDTQDKIPQQWHEVTVKKPTRIDWIFPVANLSPQSPPNDWIPESYRSKEQVYSIYVPSTLDRGRAAPLILHISPAPRIIRRNHWEPICEKLGAILVSPHEAQNDVDSRTRTRIVLDVLDDVRRTYAIDPDRTYVSGFSGGARMACRIAFALPEYFGGVLAICAAGELRNEVWTGQRVVDRLSVVFVTGTTDFNREEVESFRGPLLKSTGTRVQVTTLPMDHEIPPARDLAAAVLWLDRAKQGRAELANVFPTTRVASDTVLDRQSHARQLLDEAKTRLQQEKTFYSGMMLLRGIVRRWPDLPEAKEARRRFERNSSKGTWHSQELQQRNDYLLAKARGMDAYASGHLHDRYTDRRSAFTESAIEMWNSVLKNKPTKDAEEEAQQRVKQLKASNQ